MSKQQRRKIDERDYRGLCVFCGQQLLMLADEGEVMHGMPTCERFDRLSPLDFVIAHRRALGLPAPAEYQD